jgi:hypothetical protein
VGGVTTFVILIILAIFLIRWGYDFRIKTMCGSYLTPVLCMSYLRYVCLFTHSGVQHILCCVVFLFCLSSSCVPYICYQCLSIVDLWLLLRYSLTFIYGWKTTGGTYYDSVWLISENSDIRTHSLKFV